MKKILYRNMIFLILLITAISCSKDLSPSLNTAGKLKQYDSATHDYYFVEAVKQKLMGNSGEAIKRLEQCIKINPESDAAYFQMAQIYFGFRERDNAMIYARKAYELAPENYWYIMMLAGVYYNENKLDTAIYYYEQAVKLRPDREDLLLSLGNMYSENGKYDMAGDIFNSLDQKYGINEESTLSNIRNLMLSGKNSEALEITKSLIVEFPEELMYRSIMAEIYRTIGQSDKAMEVYSEMIEENPDNPEIQLSLCDFLLKERKYEELFEVVNSVILNNAIRREDKISLIGTLIETNEIVEGYQEEILDAISIIEEEYRNDDLIVLLRPELFSKRNNYKDAIIILEKITEENPDNYYASEKLLITYLENREYKKLQERGKEIAKRFNRSFIAKMLYASGATENKDYETALEELGKAEILAGNQEELLMQVISLKADVYYRQKNYSKAFETFEDALKIDNKDMTVLNNYAYYLAEQDMNLKVAERMAEQVIKNEGANSTFMDTYAWVLYKRGKIKQARKVMESIIAGDETPDAEWYEHLGFIYKAGKDCKKAINTWNIAIQLDKTKTHLIEEIEKCKK
ncbi:MAG: tetratricopeptide repeat protein [Bacteroidetes bacterium]|jgi:tetratricopeptide (TPR) repeat protein|nr:tetratricopeptide repeat protein [Bacteroidota bacterium]